MSLKPFTVTSTHGEVKASFAGRMFYSAIKKNMMKQFSGGSGDNGDEFTKIIDAMLEDMPLRQLAMLSAASRYFSPAYVRRSGCMERSKSAMPDSASTVRSI